MKFLKLDAALLKEPSDSVFSLLMSLWLDASLVVVMVRMQ